MCGSAHGRRKGPPDSGSAKTLYDVLGVRPDDDAGTLKEAFRKAAKANHPDLHADDPDAPMRFRRITGAYAILRHEQQRAVYDRLLEFEREQLRSKTTRIISYMMRNIVSDAVAAVCLGVVLAGGYTLFANVSKAPVATATVVDVKGRTLAEIAALQPAARTDTADEDEPRDKLARAEVPDLAAMPSAASSEATVDQPHDRPARLETPDIAIAPTAVASIANREEAPDRPAREEIPDAAVAAPTVASSTSNGDASGVADGGSVPGSAEPDKQAVATMINGVDASSDGADVEAMTDQLKKADGINSREHNKTEPAEVEKMTPAEVRLSSLETGNPIAKSSSSDFARSNEQHDLKMPGKPRTAAKRQAANHTSFKQASLENRTTSGCAASPSCSGNVPPLFGVGF